MHTVTEKKASSHIEQFGKRLPRRTKNLLIAFAEGLPAYLTYHSRCGTGQIYTEYLLYEPILRIAQHLKWSLRNEVAVDKKTNRKKRGDKERIDFIFEGAGKEGTLRLLLEVKWVSHDAQHRSLSITNDVAKLLRIKKQKEKNIADVAAAVLIIGKEIEEKVCKLSKNESCCPDYYFFEIEAEETQYGGAVLLL